MNKVDIIYWLINTLFSGIGTWYIQERRYSNIIDKNKKKRNEYDIFISYPMKGLKNEEDKNILKDIVIKVKNNLERNFPKIKVFVSIDDDSSEGKLLRSKTENFEALSSSNCFIFIYPKEVVSSVLIEAGYAIALNKICIFLSPSKESLPYLLALNIDREKNFFFFSYKKCSNLPELITEIAKNDLNLKKTITNRYKVRI